MDEVMPVPFIGNVRDSEIMILMSNPKYREDTKEKESIDYKEKLMKVFNLESMSYPLFGLDPDIEVGKEYWESKLRGLIGIYKDWEEISKKVSVIQLHPYERVQALKRYSFTKI